MHDLVTFGDHSVQPFWFDALGNTVARERAFAAADAATAAGNGPVLVERVGGLTEPARRVTR